MGGEKGYRAQERADAYGYLVRSRSGYVIIGKACKMPPKTLSQLKKPTNGSSCRPGPGKRRGRAAGVPADPCWLPKETSVCSELAKPSGVFPE